MRFEKKYRKIQKEIEDLNSLYANLIKEAAGDSDAVGSLYAERRSEMSILEIEKGLLVTRELVREAETRFVVIPPSEDERYWTRLEDRKEFSVLTSAGINHLRNLIREEAKKDREAKFAYLEIIVKIVTILTGLGGTLIGLLSIWQRNP